MITSKHLEAQRGSALLTGMVTVLVLTTLAAAFLTTAHHNYLDARRTIARERAFQAAEAGLDTALVETRLGGDLSTDGVGVASGDAVGGTFAVAIDPAFDGGGVYTLTATGTYDRRQRVIETVVRTNSVYMSGFFARQDIVIGGGITDAYSSRAGDYASQTYDHGGETYAEEDGNVACNGNITMSGSGLVHGDATPGPAGIVNKPDQVTGATAPATANVDVEPYVYDPGANVSLGTLEPKTADPVLITEGVYRYDSIVVGGGNTVTITGNVTLYCDHKLTLSGGSQVILAAGARLTIYHGHDDLVLSGGGVINTSQRPSDCQIFSATDRKVTYSGGSDFYGGLYAPDADFTLGGGGNAYGAVVANNISMTGGSSFHVDTSLRGNAGGSGIQVLLLREIKGGGS